MPYATPWNAMLTSEESSASIESVGVRPLLLRMQLLPRILQGGGERFDLDVREHAADAPHFAQIFVLDDVPRLRIDRDGAARARRVLVLLDDLHRPVRVDLALELADHMEDQLHRVVGADDEEAGEELLAVLLLVRGDERLVGRTVAGGRVVVRGDGA